MSRKQERIIRAFGFQSGVIIVVVSTIGCQLAMIQPRFYDEKFIASPDTDLTVMVSGLTTDRPDASTREFCWPILIYIQGGSGRTYELAIEKTGDPERMRLAELRKNFETVPIPLRKATLNEIRGIGLRVTDANRQSSGEGK